MTPWTCTQCGRCCQTTPYVTVTAEERALLDARRDGLAWQPDPAPGFWRLMAAPCPLYVAGQGCSVYDVRPYNCRRYASLTGYSGSARDGQRVRVQIQRKAQRWADRHGWSPFGTATGTQ